MFHRPLSVKYTLVMLIVLHISAPHFSKRRQPPCLYVSNLCNCSNVTCIIIWALWTYMGIIILIMWTRCTQNLKNLGGTLKF